MRKFLAGILLLAIIGSVIGLCNGVYDYKSRGVVPFVGFKYEWVIGLFMSKAPFHGIMPTAIKNPVLTAEDISDIEADFVADPFVIKTDSQWHMFFEVMNGATNQGDIGLAASTDGLAWTYRQIVLDEPFHLSYPHIFKWKGAYYMTPECSQTHAVRLYRADKFPSRWKFCGTLLSGKDFVDTSVIYFDHKWWLFTSAVGTDTLWLYYADEPVGPWTEHPLSPIVKENPNIARPAGKFLIYDNRVIRYAQDDHPTYGNQIHAFEITRLTTTNYREKQIDLKPILEEIKSDWNTEGLHHIDLHLMAPHKWVGYVDGLRKKLAFGLKH